MPGVPGWSGSSTAQGLSRKARTYSTLGILPGDSFVTRLAETQPECVLITGRSRQGEAGRVVITGCLYLVLP